MPIPNARPIPQRFLCVDSAVNLLCWSAIRIAGLYIFIYEGPIYSAAARMACTSLLSLYVCMCVRMYVCTSIQMYLYCQAVFAALT